MLKFVKIQDPPEALKDYIWFIAVLEDAPAQGGSFNYDVVPLGDACIVFSIFGWAGPERGPAGLSFLLVSGPMSKLMKLIVTPRQVLVVRLRAGGFQAMFGAPAHKIKNNVVLLDKFWGAGGKAWAQRLRQAPDTEARVEVLKEELLRRADGFKKPDLYSAKAVELMAQSSGKLTVEELSKKLGYTERQIQRKFEDGLGLTPKEYQRVLRCRLMILRMLNGDFKDWAQLVEDHGFSDQGHMIREFKGFMGVAPEKFLKQFKNKGRILESPLPGLRDETALLGYEDGTALDSPPSEGFIQLDVETVLRQSEAFAAWPQGKEKNPPLPPDENSFTET